MLPPPLDWARTGPGAGVGGLSEGYTNDFYPSLCFLNLTWTLAHDRYKFLIALALLTPLLSLSPGKTGVTFDPQSHNKGVRVEGVRGRDILGTLPLPLSTCW